MYPYIYDISSAPRKISGIDDDEDASSSSMKLFGFSILPMSNNDNKIEERGMMMMNKKSNIMMIMNTTTETSFKCEFCGQSFANSQALGGHQNAHKTERRLLKLNSASKSYHQNYNNKAITPAARRRWVHYDEGGRNLRRRQYSNSNFKEYCGEPNNNGVDLELRLAPTTPHHK